LVFQCGTDYFGELRDIGVPMDSHGRHPERGAAEDAWHRLGARFLAEATDPVRGAPWALKQFGEPHAD
jgi:hypothetical protein